MLEQAKRFSEFKFGTRFRELLKTTDVSSLAKELGISSESTFRQWTNGYTLPTCENLYKLSKYFNVTTDYLLGLSEVSSPDIDAQAAYIKYGLEEKTLLNLEEWKYYDRPFFINQKRIIALNVLCTNEHGYTVLDHVAAYLFDEIEDVTVPVKNNHSYNEKLTIKKEAFSKVFLSLACDYLSKLKGELFLKKIKNNKKGVDNNGGNQEED